MHFFLKYMAGFCLAFVVGIAVGTVNSSAQQLVAQQSSSSSSSMAPLSSGVPQLGRYTAAPQGSQLIFSHSTVRLIAGEYNNGKWTAGVEIVLAPGWKTYWRVPGDAGVPAEFIWKNSTNVKSAKVFWPAPKRYKDITGKSIGYKKHVIFPVTVTPVNNGKPARLDLRLYYAMCSDICIPAQANLALDLPIEMQSNLSSQRIRRFAARVPGKQAKGVIVAEAKAVTINGKPVLSVKLLGKVDPKTDILVEGFEDAFFEAPKRASKANGEHVFHLPIDGIDKPSELSGKTLLLTVLSGDIRLEKSVTLN